MATFVDQASPPLTIAYILQKPDAKEENCQYRKSAIAKFSPDSVKRIYTDGDGEFQFADNLPNIDHTIINSKL